MVRGSGIPVRPIDVRQRLQSIGFDLSKYANDLAAIHTILERLNESGELRVIARGHERGKHAYLWHHGPHAAVLRADIAAFMRDANLERDAIRATEEPSAKPRARPSAKASRRVRG